MNKYFNFDTTYTKLPPVFYQEIEPDKVPEAEILLYNKEYAKELNVLDGASDKEIADILSGNIIIENSRPIAEAYCGHQFGYLNELGDGRAVLLGEHILSDGTRVDVALKGSGKTKYARSGDGKANVGPMLREYLISEAMHNLKIKSTRSLAVIKTGEKVHRGVFLDGAILARFAKSHIRVGTFEFAAIQKDDDLLRKLADYTIDRHYPFVKNDENMYLSFLKEVIKNQIDLIVDWMRVGFVHGVMNTDNVSIAGETIDYGPCAFIDAYNTNTVFSSIDIYGRYAFGNQPRISAWNMARFAESLIPLIADNDEKSLEIINKELSKFLENYNKVYLDMLAKKIAFKTYDEEDKDLLNVLLDMMQLFAFDYTNTFLYLRSLLKPLNFDNDILLPKNEQAREVFYTWVDEWKKRLESKMQSIDESLEIMESVNPIIIPRNHIVQKAIKDAEKGDIKGINELNKLLLNPYDYSFNKTEYILPSNSDKKFVTYCGT